MKRALILLPLLLAACAQEPPRETVRIISVPSSSPYKYLTFTELTRR